MKRAKRKQPEWLYEPKGSYWLHGHYQRPFGTGGIYVNTIKGRCAMCGKKVPKWPK